MGSRGGRPAGPHTEFQDEKIVRNIIKGKPLRYERLGMRSPSGAAHASVRRAPCLSPNTVKSKKIITTVTLSDVLKRGAGLRAHVCNPSSQVVEAEAAVV